MFGPLIKAWMPVHAKFLHPKVYRRPECYKAKLFGHAVGKLAGNDGCQLARACRRGHGIKVGKHQRYSLAMRCLAQTVENASACSTVLGIDGIVKFLKKRLAGFDISGRQPAAILLLHDLQTKAEIPAGRDEDKDDRRPEPAPRSQTRAELFDAVTQDIRNNLDDSDVSLSWLASRHGISPRRIRDLFYAENTNFTDYLLSARLERAKEILSDPELGHINVASIALECGFGDISWFHHTFRRRFKLTPADMRKTRKDLK